jgi:hypothetical protein
MKSLKKFALAALAILFFAVSPLAIAQTQVTGGTNTLYSTTLAAAVNQTQNTVLLTSTTNLLVGHVLYIDGELMTIAKTWNGTSTTVPVSRYGGKVNAHVINAIVLFGYPRWFSAGNPIPGACPVPITTGGATPATINTTPWMNTLTGEAWRCYAGQWGKVATVFIPPQRCSFLPTTLTQTTTFPVLGVGATVGVPVINSVTNAAAGTDTLSCFLDIPADTTAGRSSLLTDLTLTLGSQTVAPTSLGTPLLGSIQFPTPAATTQTASSQTIVTSAGGTITQLGPTTTVLSVTTAGDFLTFNYSFGTPVDLTTDLRTLVFQLPILQSAASAMTVNSAGIYAHVLRRN